MKKPFKINWYYFETKYYIESLGNVKDLYINNFQTIYNYVENELFKFEKITDIELFLFVNHLNLEFSLLEIYPINFNSKKSVTNL